MDESGVPAEGEFMKQFGGSAAANALTMLIFALLWGIKKVCDRPSRCHTCCLDIEVSDRKATERTKGPISVADKGESIV